MGKHARLLFIAVFVFLLLGEAAAAKPPTTPSGNLTVSPFFGSHMVLQRDMVVPVFGTAPAGTIVTVEFNGQSRKVLTPPTDKWRVDLDPMNATFQGDSLVITSGSTTITLDDVLVGEVWVLSGQSNVNVLLRDCIGGPEAVSESGNSLYTSIRLIQRGSLTAPWEVSAPANTTNWSGVAFFFARSLVENMLEPVPIGIYQIAVNGTGINQWVVGGRQYNNHILPLQPMAIRGVIWYQGEDDAGKTSTALAYYTNLPLLINGWRAAWGQQEETFPFYIIQLALINGRPNFAIIRDAQVSALDSVSNTGLACIIDIPTVPSTDIHPKDKEPVGYRLALIARANLYGEEGLVYSGPIRNKDKSSVNEGSIIVGFDHVIGGFTIESDTPLGPFMLAGADGVYQPATAEVVGPDTIKVSSPSVSAPMSVRYGWASYPLCNLFNGFSLPASPFELTFP